eukprot:Gregarina_sp_Poly_1__11198@NODE_916_length_5724_cov_311_910553_g651_i0_p3_GENE_NODE_916_length_5724_cov_311_910553_g651_i0NODE_916_length_5724_cov_311_910553_g651_i0_p3_ORF_typecomplete_len248_score41_79Ank_4/PF13637_6/4_7e02Ank_4/PF13637_6/9_4e06Ank_4/PF13637_6/2_2e09Ank_4/PF13637_6/2_5e06Ank_4/PF13637_6/5e10Ank_4/PF13637_6/0_0048Ank_2/PF12796_7/3_7e09Ank_2/PF12796_7/1_7e09Ank_2/PF12796_7/6_1e11Ank_2/PF12796_7/0_01Ank_5/PF13857_6/4_5e03Ank_5/PF13857_6/2_5e06Ank_5/PF13857_6/0_66Ank_5/PF13857_6/3
MDSANVETIGRKTKQALMWQEQKLWRELWKNNKNVILDLWDEDHRSVFHWCVDHDCLNFLQDCIDEVKRRDPKTDLFDCPDDGGWTPFHLACASGNVKVLNTLIKAGAKIDRIVESTGNNGLHIAAGKGLLETCQSLLNELLLRGRDREFLESRNAQGYTPLLKAVSSDRLEVTKFLISRHAEITVRDPTSQECILHLAVVNGNVEMTEWLLENHPKLALCEDNLENNAEVYARGRVADVFENALKR